MAEILLEALAREEKGKSVRRLRRSGFIPAVIYGIGKTGQSVKIDQKIFTTAVKGHVLDNLVVHLKLHDQADAKPRMALIRDFQMDPLKDTIIHVDFQEVSLERKLRTKVRIESIGDPVGVTQEGGLLECALREIEIECLPMNIPESIDVDVSQLRVGGSLHVGDIAVPEGIEVLTTKELVVFTVAAVRAEEEAPKEAEMTEPEVIGKKKETEEAEAPAEKKEAES